jgi:hypothetical protein
MDQTVPEVSHHEEMGQAVPPSTESETMQETAARPVQRDSVERHQTPVDADTLSYGQNRPCSDGVANQTSDATHVHCPLSREHEQCDSFSRSIDFSVKNENRLDRGWQPLGEVVRRVVGDVVARLGGDTVSLTD